MLIEKDKLLPFEEAKLYGHNAIHALMAYLGALKGYTKMSELRTDTVIMQTARAAFIQESGAALIRKYSRLNDELFTEAGFKKYAEDLLDRMTNPYLEDTIERAGRDPVRKLGLHDRLFGTMTLCLGQGIEPENMALGALAGIIFLLQRAKENKLPKELWCADWQSMTNSQIEMILIWLWNGQQNELGSRLIKFVQKAMDILLKRVLESE